VAGDSWTWDARDAVWDEAYGLLEEYVQQKGNALVPSTYRTANGFRLGQWVSVQRTKYGQGIIAKERLERLEALPDRTWDFKDSQWEEGVRHLAEYIETHGDSLMPLKYTSKDGYQLGGWVNTQRVAYGKGTLPPHRKRRLREMAGWSWSAKQSFWEEGLSRLARYAEAHGHANVPQNYADADGYQLGSWVTTQRAAQKAGRLKPERKARLSALPGWIWNPRAENWETGYARLLRYVETFHDADVPRAYVDDTGYYLGSWVATRRQQHKNCTLDADCERRLQDLPGWSWGPSHAAKWEQGLRQLLHYVERHGDARVPADHIIDGYRLGVWVAKQRIKRRKGALDPDREDRLQQLPGWIWESRANDWEENFCRLLDYVKRHGDAAVPQHYHVDGYRLGRWVSRQRQSHKKGILDADCERRLEALPGWTWTASSST
jgi:hypothetical protein